MEISEEMSAMKIPVATRVRGRHRVLRRRRRLPLMEIICLLTLGLTMIFTLPAAAAGEAKEAYTNRLIKSRDPYLLLHAHNPVDWYPWGPEALERARRENKPIFVSIGYSTCYWCHVAERELYSDPKIAKLMNKWFINIKVDREERPDLDGVYMQAREVLTGHGGWPNNVFLTPRLRPFFAGSYFPPKAGGGRPGFPDVLRGLHKAWTLDRGRVDEVAGEVYNALHKAAGEGVIASERPLNMGQWLDEARNEAATAFDEAEAGFVNGPTKFPNTPRLSMLLAEYRDGHNEKSLKMVTRTLTAMAEGGIMDQLGGGFHRYSTTSDWSIPHFEKMLVDNAQLLGLYAQAYAVTKRPLFRQAALRTARYLTEEMQAPGNGFYSAQDAEAGGIEGGSYVWTRRQIERVLGAEKARRFFTLYDLTPMPPALAGHRQTPGGVLRLKRESARKPAGDNGLAAAIEALAPMRKKLLSARRARIQPARDEKIVTSDNALAIIGFTEAGEALHNAGLTKRAVKTAQRLWEQAYDPKSGELRHQFFKGLPGGPGFLDDYALIGRAFMELYHSTNDGLWLARAEQVAGSMLRRFALPHGSLATSWDRSGLLAAPPARGDSGKPSGISAAMGLLLDLAASAHEERYSLTALSALMPLQDIISANPSNWAALLTSLEKPNLRRALDSAVKARRSAKNQGMTDSAGHVRVRGQWLSSGETPNLILTVNIDPGYHINANPPSPSYLVATELLVKGYPGVKVDYPASKTFKAKFAPQGIAVYDGSITLKARLPQGSSPAPPALSLRVQACNETLCLAPALIRVPLEKTEAHGK